MAKLWGGRFTKNTDAFAEGFHSSISFDSRMYKQDITGSIAHARMLGRQGILSGEDVTAIVGGLESILSDIEAGKVSFSPHDEDIHMNVERLLTERIAEELLVSNKTLQTIAEEYGFCDAYYLSAFFKRTMGTSPAIYRKQHER